MAQGPPDRRERPRLRSIGTAVLYRASGERAQLAIRDLSTNGARLVGATGAREGELVRVSLELDAQLVWLTAELTRTDTQNAQVAIAFRDLTPEGLQTIEAALDRAVARARELARSSVLVFHPDPEIRGQLERDLSLLERSPTSCATPLEVMWALHEPVAHDTLIAPADARDLLTHVIEHAPAMRRVLLFDGALRSIDHELSNRVSAVLRTPWRIRTLARALAIDTNDSSMALLPDDLE